jgi:hypothetical protein
LLDRIKILELEKAEFEKINNKDFVNINMEVLIKENENLKRKIQTLESCETHKTIIKRSEGQEINSTNELLSEKIKILEIEKEEIKIKNKLDSENIKFVLKKNEELKKMIEILEAESNKLSNKTAQPQPVSDATESIAMLLERIKILEFQKEIELNQKRECETCAKYGAVELIIDERDKLRKKNQSLELELIDLREKNRKPAFECETISRLLAQIKLIENEKAEIEKKSKKDTENMCDHIYDLNQKLKNLSKNNLHDETYSNSYTTELTQKIKIIENEKLELEITSKREYEDYLRSITDLNRKIRESDELIIKQKEIILSSEKKLLEIEIKSKNENEKLLNEINELNRKISNSEYEDKFKILENNMRELEINYRREKEINLELENSKKKEIDILSYQNHQLNLQINHINYDGSNHFKELIEKIRILENEKLELENIYKRETEASSLRISELSKRNTQLEILTSELSQNIKDGGKLTYAINYNTQNESLEKFKYEYEKNFERVEDSVYLIKSSVERYTRIKSFFERIESACKLFY